MDEQQEQITSLQSELESIRFAMIEAQQLKYEHNNLQKKCLEYELSLEEIGRQLQE